ncbi:DUF2225 domain-containing protein [Desulfotruncus alcoholivorax]|uniref:DUF2225 domain-containing protein n=1 Tax=Desulfotruncus alcoholivorax TaxID=265477 RepID=UPI001EE554CA|nr:DUF2225 domain-containing protein [Desulfotruncus alcoholivorax]
MLIAKEAGKNYEAEKTVKASEPHLPDPSGAIEYQKQETTDKTPPVNKNFSEHTYTAKKVCPLCRQETEYTAVKSRYVQLEKTDGDMCGYYRLINPSYYYVIVCTHCGYAFTLDDNLKLDSEKTEIIKNKLNNIKLNQDFSGTRSINQAINAYRLAIACQTMAENKSSVIGYLFLRLGCLYRHKNMQKEESYCLTRALEYFDHAYKNEGFKSIKEELNIIYLIGELNIRAGDASKAINWFGMIINHPSKQEYPYIVKKAKDRWQEIRLENKK